MDLKEQNYSIPDQYLYSPDNKPKQMDLLTRLAGAWMMFGSDYKEKFLSIAHHLDTSYTTIVKTYFGYANDDSDMGARCVYPDRVNSRVYNPENTVRFWNKIPTDHCITEHFRCKYIGDCPLRKVILNQDFYEGQLVEAQLEVPRVLEADELYVLFTDFKLRAYLNKTARYHQKAKYGEHFQEYGSCIAYNPETTEYKIIDYEDRGMNSVVLTQRNIEEISSRMKKGWIMLSEIHLQPMEPLEWMNADDQHPLVPSPEDFNSALINSALQKDRKTHPLNIIYNVIGKNKLRLLIYQLDEISSHWKPERFRNLSVHLNAPRMHERDIVDLFVTNGLKAGICEFDLSTSDNPRLREILAQFSIAV